MSILAADSPHFPDILFWFLLIAGTVISLAIAMTGWHRLRDLRPPPEDPISTLALVLGGTLGFLLVGTAGAAALVSGITPEELRTQVAGLIGTVTAVIGALLLNSIYRRDGLRRLGLASDQFLHGIGSGILWLILIVPWIFWINLGVETAMKRFHIDSPTMHEIFRIWDTPQGKSLGFRAIAIVAAVIIAPFSEELLFRGLLQSLLVRILNPSEKAAAASRRSIVAILITSALFAAIHRPWTIQPAIFVLSIGLGLAYERRGNLWTSITIHCLFNALNFVIFLSSH